MSAKPQRDPPHMLDLAIELVRIVRQHGSPELQAAVGGLLAAISREIARRCGG